MLFCVKLKKRYFVSSVLKTRRLTTVCLISSILTVVLLITGPAHRYAATTRTSKEVDWAFKFTPICKTTEKNMELILKKRDMLKMCYK